MRNELIIDKNERGAAGGEALQAVQIERRVFVRDEGGFGRMAANNVSAFEYPRGEFHGEIGDWRGVM